MRPKKIVKSRSVCKCARLFGVITVLLLLLCGSIVSQASSARINGIHYVSLEQVSLGLGMEYRSLEDKAQAKVWSKSNELNFSASSLEYKLNGLRIHLSYPVESFHEKLYISQIDYDRSVSSLLWPQKLSQEVLLRRIVVDAGHGGRDSGAENEKLKLKEKSLTLDMAKRLKRRLEDFGFDVLLTRDKDEFIPLKERANFANRQGADLFISVHFNSLDKITVQGVETYCFTPRGVPSSSRSELREEDMVFHHANENDSANALFAYFVQSKMIKELKAVDRGLKRARFAVLKPLKCPGILVECGFISNSAEAALINSDAYRDRLAKAIANGVFLYQKTMNGLMNL